ncbi:MAG: DNA-directed DNA polymerase [Candidatus Pacearchaeota archaeon]|jgi:DNA polymerase elongation subunit (family B)
MKNSFEFIPIDYDYFDFEGKNYARIIGKTDKNKKACIIDSCDIYFWAILKPNIPEKRIKELQIEIEKITIENSQRNCSVLSTEIKNKNFLGNKVKAIKIFITNAKDAHDIANKLDFEEIDKRREYDLDFITKYILEKKFKPLHWYKIEGEILNNSNEFGGIDKGLDVDICLKLEKHSLINKEDFKPKILAYDIETDEFEIGKGEIVMISLIGENYKKVLSWKKESLKHNYVEKFNSEKEMIDSFVKYVKEYSPDILTGYYSDGFDLPYLRQRAEKNKTRLNLGVDNTQPTLSKGKLMTAKIKGIVHLDIFRFIKVVYGPYLQSETMSLNDVASELLGDKKVKFEFKHSSKLTIDEWETFFEYNLQDSILTYRLAEKIWPDLMEFSKVVGEPLFNVSRYSMSNHVENYLIHNIEKYNEIIEKKPISEIGDRMAEERFEGAFVFQPKPGLYEDIVFFDFTSMYGSVIVTFNLSRSTFRNKKESDTTEVDLDKKKVYFSKKPGFFPEMLGDIIEKRKKYKKEYAEKKDPLSKARSNAFKLLANASYGYQGFFGARYYCLEAAASTAALARKYIHETIETIEKKGYEVVYSDTDSIAFLRDKNSKKEVLQTLKEINESLPGIMELDLEDFYKRGIWVTKRTGDFGAKKKYALITEEGKLKIRGFETVRRDWCELARVTQNNVLDFILNEGTKEHAIEYVKDIIKKLKERKIPLKQLLIRTQLKKSIEEYKSESPHVTIAKKMKERNIRTEIGMLMEYYISESASHNKKKNGKSKQLIRERAKLPDEEGLYDIDYYLDNQLLPAVENILEVFDIKPSELLEGKKQTSLGDF